MRWMDVTHTKEGKYMKEEFEMSAGNCELYTRETFQN
jgi:hypothetical protein